MSAHLGKDCKLFRGNHIELLGVVDNVRDVTLNMETGEADVTTRAASGWRVYLATLKEATLEFEMLVDSSDDNYKAIRTAFLTGEGIDLFVQEGNEQDYAWYFTGEVTGFGNSQPLEDGDTVSVTVRPKTPVRFEEMEH